MWRPDSRQRSHSPAGRSDSAHNNHSFILRLRARVSISENLCPTKRLEGTAPRKNNNNNEILRDRDYPGPFCDPNPRAEPKKKTNSDQSSLGQASQQAIHRLRAEPSAFGMLKVRFFGPTLPPPSPLACSVDNERGVGAVISRLRCCGCENNRGQRCASCQEGFCPVS